MVFSYARGDKQAVREKAITFAVKMNDALPNGAYVLAALTRELKTTNRDRVIEEYEKIKGTPKYQQI